MHTVTIVCDCSYYESRFDDNLLKRINLTNPSLHQLEAIIVSDLIENLVIYDGKNPAISLKRMNPYHELYHSAKSERFRSDIEIDDEGIMRMPLQFISQIRKKCSCKDNDRLYYQIFIDTRDRLIRANFFRTDDNIYIFRMLFDSNAHAMSTIFNVISDNNFDIVGCQMNFLPKDLAEGMSLIDEKFASLDLVLRSTKNESYVQESIIRDLVDQMRANKGDAIRLDEESMKLLLAD